MGTLLHPKIQKLKARSGPLSYENVLIDNLPKLEERAGLLDKRVVEGYGCIWNSRNLHGEKFIKGSFAKSIREHGPNSGSAYEIKFYNEHCRALALFDVLEENEIGLYFRTKPLDEVKEADELLVQLKSKTINNFSNAFNYVWDKIEWDDRDDSMIIIEARLFHISAVGVPSDMNTYAIRSLAENTDELLSLYDETDDFIRTLPRKDQLQARQLFTRHKSLVRFDEKSPAEILKERNSKPLETGLEIDYSYLIENL